ncbi:DUF5957 family protein [Cohnella hongkongensis]|uniref:DUF5957 family protein n=1 Tax=Cohnella hongkongensis TaxID=178337 RepID=A0ABV9FDJ3_9BACL
MRNKAGILLFAVLGGCVGGFILSELIGVAGMLIFDRAVGIKYLPILLPIVCAVVALIVVNGWTRSKSRGG